jgi:S1-C subfamily serine protease
VSLQNLTPDLVSKYKAGSLDGALVNATAASSPAERAGIKAGDIVRRFNGRPVKDTAGLRSRLTEVDVGERIELTYVRNGVEMRATAEIGEAPPEPELPPRRR